MPRRTAIRRKTTEKKVVMSSRKKPSKYHDPSDMITTIKVPCMTFCGNFVCADVNTKDIVPKLGRPRGLRLLCHACKQKVRVYSSGLMQSFDTSSV